MKIHVVKVQNYELLKGFDSMAKNKKRPSKIKRILQGERAIYFTIIFILLAIPVCNVYTKAILSSSNIALEQTKSKIKDQESINDGLKMEISELASLDKIQVVATENGLSYENNNIKVVTSE